MELEMFENKHEDEKGAHLARDLKVYISDLRIFYLSGLFISEIFVESDR